VMHALYFRGSMELSVQRIDTSFIVYYDIIQSMNDVEEDRWQIIKSMLDEFPELRRRVREYLREEYEKES